MKFLIFLLIIPFASGLGVYPSSFENADNGYFVVYNDNSVRTNFSFSSDLDIKFEPETLELDPGNFSKVDFLIREEINKSEYRVYIQEVSESYFENSLGIKLLFDKISEPILIKEDKKIDGYISDVRINGNKPGLIRIDSVFVNQGRKVEAYSNVEVYYENELIDILKSESYLIEDKKVIPVYYNLTNLGYYFFKVKINYNNLETDELSANLDIKEEPKQVNYGIFVFVGLLFLVVLLVLIVRFLNI
ncbi:MAG: hypothetical protein PHE43_02630 [Candidatus Nanoarchaeia archaeon]|nr:hypothetical protein [Candidatus Nanoarchaeia archaeon]